MLTTVAVIAGWQLAARVYPWLDALASIIVAAMILYLAHGLFKRAIPVLVERSIANPEALSSAASAVAGVQETRRVRSREGGSGSAIDLIVSVDPNLSPAESHAIAHEIERVISEKLSANDVTMHIEPHWGRALDWALAASANTRAGQNREVLDDINRIGGHKKTTRYNETRQLQAPGQERR